MVLIPVVNPLFLISGSGMILVALAAVLLWRRKARWSFFALGGLAWLVAIILKGVISFYLNRPVYFATQHLPGAISGPAYWLYTGLLTGIFEVGLVLFLVNAVYSLRRATWQEAVAFGIGFGALEALALGLPALLTVIWGLRGILPPAAAMPLMVRQGALLWALAPVVERAFTIPIHIAAAVLVIYGVRVGRLRWFWLAFIYKTAVDAVAAFGQIAYGLHTTGHLWTIEAVIALLGLIGLWITAAMQRQFEMLW
ncbi:MAG: hypothetical protein PWP70_877 [Moorella sp. (in: firmicutes)]|nr:hypothetical protein [Moorella sp. (in: firmicutes)]